VAGVAWQAGGSPRRALSSFETEMRSAAKGGRPIGRFLLTGALTGAAASKSLKGSTHEDPRMQPETRLDTWLRG
jgi:hypothetical protein